ncbi:unnamed protein product [Angiostrongylus costaricensis]|uniref:SUN domain-containing protein n=1 Tax=Angiostrongylus costaricensis TaxID=334426 RepID=A0A158PK77_ANGCS|nr:unnamed protein product [Angiostrongylus costaricensis]
MFDSVVRGGFAGTTPREMKRGFNQTKEKNFVCLKVLYMENTEMLAEHISLHHNEKDGPVTQSQLLSNVRVILNRTFYISVIWSRYFWFLTRDSLIGTVIILFVAGLLSQAMRADILPRSGLIRIDKEINSMEIVDSRLGSFEKKRLMWELLYNEKLKNLEQVMFNSLSEIRSETQKLHAEVERYRSEQERLIQGAAKTFGSYFANQLKGVEAEVSSRLNDIESRIAATNEQMLKYANSCLTFSKSSCLESTAGVMARRHAVNLASRSHGASVVPHLTSKPVTSESLLYTFVDAVFGLQTYNFAITERTHIMPSEAFCFAGSEGNLTIRLWSNTTIEAVEYEHDYWRNHVPISAPKHAQRCTMSVYLLEDGAAVAPNNAVVSSVLDDRKNKRKGLNVTALEIMIRFAYFEIGFHLV